MSDAQMGMTARMIGAASQGAVGAVIGALLASLTEPIVNRLLVNRMSLADAIAAHSPAGARAFFGTALSANFVKFPFFEVVSSLMGTVDISPALRGSVAGAVFTTATLPITNYRYCKSTGAPVDFKDLYKAYMPTVLRDIVYGSVRGRVAQSLFERDPAFAATTIGRFVNMFVTIFASCILSAPGNELRGFMLQAPGPNHKSLVDFFQFDRLWRSSLVGGTIMSIALGTSVVLTPWMQDLVTKIRSIYDRHPVSYLLVVLFAAHHYLRRNATEGCCNGAPRAAHKGQCCGK